MYFGIDWGWREEWSLCSDFMDVLWRLIHCCIIIVIIMIIIIIVVVVVVVIVVVIIISLCV